MRHAGHSTRPPTGLPETPAAMARLAGDGQIAEIVKRNKGYAHSTAAARALAIKYPFLEAEVVFAVEQVCVPLYWYRFFCWEHVVAACRGLVPPCLLPPMHSHNANSRDSQSRCCCCH